MWRSATRSSTCFRTSPRTRPLVFGALTPGGSYFAVMGVHAQSPLMSAWHAEHAAELGLPRLYGPDEVVGVFVDMGFSVSVANLKLGFVPVSAHRHGHDHRGDLIAWLDYYIARQGLAAVHPALILTMRSNGTDSSPAEPGGTSSSPNRRYRTLMVFRRRMNKNDLSGVWSTAGSTGIGKPGTRAAGPPEESGIFRLSRSARPDAVHPAASWRQIHSRRSSGVHCPASGRRDWRRDCCGRTSVAGICARANDESFDLGTTCRRASSSWMDRSRALDPTLRAGCRRILILAGRALFRLEVHDGTQGTNRTRP